MSLNNQMGDGGFFVLASAKLKKTMECEEKKRTRKKAKASIGNSCFFLSLPLEDRFQSPKRSAVMSWQSWLSYSDFLSGLPVPVVLSRLSCSDFPVLS
jgi:hypothetical protein